MAIRSCVWRRAASCVALLAAAALCCAASAASPSTEHVQLLVGLRQPTEGLKKLESLFWAVADPAHAEYGRHRSVAQLAELTGATPAVVESARAWLHELGASRVRLLPSRDVMVADWTVRVPPGGIKNDREVAPQVPAHLKATAVDYCIMERNVPPPPRRTAAWAAMSRRTGAAMPMDSSMGLAAQKKAYGVPASLVADHPANSQMVWGTATFGLLKQDLQLFYQNYCPHCNASQVAMGKDSVWKGATGDNTGESMLDTEYISGMTGNIKTIVSNTNTSHSTSGSTGFGVALLHFVTADLGTRAQADLPLVLSMSLGSLSFASCDKMCTALAAGGSYTYSDCWTYLADQQSQVCMYSSQDEIDRTSVEFQKLGLRGMTLTGSSGDGGSHFSFGPFALSEAQGGEGAAPNGIAEALDALVCKQMNAPVFPTGSPYILSVGGSQWSSQGFDDPDCSPGQPCAWSDAGGGFAWDFDVPPYQVTGNVTGAYLAAAAGYKVMCKSGTYNPKGRGYPDLVSLAAVGIPLCIFGGCSGSGGTSASAPTVAGMLSLINDARLKAGLHSLGFINTRLYTLAADPATRAELFVDIGWEASKVGAEWDCEAYSSCDGCDTGFPATPSWDAASGWGQPLFPGLLKHFGTDDAIPAMQQRAAAQA